MHCGYDIRSGLRAVEHFFWIGWIQTLLITINQARSQKFAMEGGLFWGVLGQSSQPLEARGSGGSASGAQNFAFFLQK